MQELSIKQTRLENINCQQKNVIQMQHIVSRAYEVIVVPALSSP